MKLLTKGILERFAKVGSQDGISDPIVIAKFFNPTGAGRWYATEYIPKDKVFFGYVSIFGDHCDEWGYFSHDELQTFCGQFGLGIERDIHFTEGKASVVIPELHGNIPFEDLSNNAA